MSSTTTAAKSDASFLRVWSTESTRATLNAWSHLLPRPQSLPSAGPPNTPSRKRRRRSGQAVLHILHRWKNWMCPDALARSMRAEVTEKHTDAKPPSCVLARVRCLPKPEGPSKATLPARRDSSASPSEVDPQHTGEEPNASPSARRFGQQHHDYRCEHCRAAANVGGECHDHRGSAQCLIADVIRVWGWVQIVGASGRARAEPQTSRKSSGDGPGTTGALLTPPKSVWHSQLYKDRDIPSPPSQSARAAGLPSRSRPLMCPLPEAWSFDARSPGPRQPPACRFAAPPAALHPSTAPSFPASFSTSSTSRVGYARSAVANCRSYDVCCR